MTDLRCEKGKIKFGEISPEAIEVTCKSRFCGWEPGLVIIHRFSHSGVLLETKKFASPQSKKREG